MRNHHRSEEFHLDKKVINVGKSLQSKGGSARDVLREQPSVRVDANDNVTLRGSENFTVLVNGRPYPFWGSDALRQIPANLIESIELMTNPSAKYEAEGSAGIINVVLRKENTRSTKAIVNVGAGTRDKYNTDATMTMNLGATKLSGGVDYRKITRFQEQNDDRRTFAPGGDIVNSTEMQRRDIRDQYNIRFGLEHQFESGHTLSFNGSGGQVHIPQSFSFDVRNETLVGTSFQQIRNDFDLTVSFFNGSAFWEYSIVPEKRQISAEAAYTRVLLPYTQTTREYASNPGFTMKSPRPWSTLLDSDAHRHEARVKVNYKDKPTASATLEAGAQSDYSIRSYDVTQALYDWGRGAWLGDAELSNAFDLTNQVHAGFVTWADKLWSIQYQLGIRAEYMDRVLEQKTLGEEFVYDRLDLFPSFSLARSFGTHQLQSADENGKLNITFGNFAETAYMGAELSASYRPARWLRLDPNLNLFRNAVKGTAFGREIDEDAFTWTARLNTVCTLSPVTRVQITGMYLSRQIGPQSTTEPLFYLSVSARREFFNRALAVTLQARNLLETAYYDVSTAGPNFANSFLIKPEVPVVNLTFTYNFNNYQPTRRREQDVDVNVGMQYHHGWHPLAGGMAVERNARLLLDGKCRDGVFAQGRNDEQAELRHPREVCTVAPGRSPVEQRMNFPGGRYFKDTSLVRGSEQAATAHACQSVDNASGIELRHGAHASVLNADGADCRVAGIPEEKFAVTNIKTVRFGDAIAGAPAGERVIRHVENAACL